MNENGDRVKIEILVCLTGKEVVAPCHRVWLIVMVARSLLTDLLLSYLTDSFLNVSYSSLNQLAVYQFTSQCEFSRENLTKSLWSVKGDRQ